MRKRALVGSVALLLSSILPGIASSADCTGPVSGLVVYNSGSVAINIGSYGWWPMCNVNQSGTWATVTVAPDSCRAWVAALQAAQRAGSNVMVQHNTSCTVASWTTPGVWSVITYP